MKTINAETNPVSAVFHSIFGGMFRIRLTDDQRPGHRHGEVLDDENNVIGSAQDYTYNGRAFAVHTKPFAGYVPLNQIEFVDTLQKGEV